MKVSLVVASGSHQGKVIPIAGQEFVIGRDPQCNLRPASQAISKRHCGLIQRDGKVFLADYGSTNGTLVNDELVKGAEVEVKAGTTLKIGPLDFIVRVEESAADQATPFPPVKPEAASAVAAAKVAAATAPKPRDATPNPAGLSKPVSAGSKELPTLAGSKEAPPAAKPSPAPAAAKPAPKPEQPAKPAAKPAAPVASGEDDIAAMLLGMDDDEGGGGVPDGSTVMEMPAQNAAETQQGDKSSTGNKPDEKKKASSREDMTNAASEILRKMMRRPK